MTPLDMSAFAYKPEGVTISVGQNDDPSGAPMLIVVNQTGALKPGDVMDIGKLLSEVFKEDWVRAEVRLTQNLTTDGAGIYNGLVITSINRQVSVVLRVVQNVDHIEADQEWRTVHVPDSRHMSGFRSISVTGDVRLLSGKLVKESYGVLAL